MTRQPSYLGLDLIRFCAAASVMLYHLSYQVWLSSADPFAAQVLQDDRAIAIFFAAGWVGVPVFFVLSGFVIAFSANDKSARDFVIGRASRLYPAAWIAATLTFLLRGAGSDWFEPYLRSMLLSPVGPWISGVYWTLGIEIAFYASIAILLALGQRRHLDTLAYLLAGVSGSFWIGRALLSAAGVRYSAVFGPDVDFWASALLIGPGCFFALGMILWSASRQGWSAAKGGAVTLCLLGGAISVLASERNLALEHGGSPAPAHLALGLWLIAVGLIAASVWWQGALWHRLGAYSASIRTIGLLTYPLYLVHDELGQSVMILARGLGAIPATLVGCVAATAAAYVITKMEKYPRTLIRRIAASRRKETPAAATLP